MRGRLLSTCALGPCIAASVARAEDEAEPSGLRPAPPKQYRTLQLLQMDITTDKTGAVSRIEFLNDVPGDVQQWLRRKVVGRHFGIPDHTYRRVVRYRVPK